MELFSLLSCVFFDFRFFMISHLRQYPRYHIPGTPLAYPAPVLERETEASVYLRTSLLFWWGEGGVGEGKERRVVVGGGEGEGGWIIWVLRRRE